MERSRKSFIYLLIVLLAFVNVPISTYASTDDAVAPMITAQSTHQMVVVNDSRTLSVTATVADGGTLSYQWYSHTMNSNSGGTAINGATSATYTVPTSVLGDTFYYVVITNTNNSVSGIQTATTASNAARVRVHEQATFTVSDTEWTFPALTVGYTTAQVIPIKKNITLTKVGVGAIDNVAVSFSEGANSSFMTGTVRPDALDDGTLSAVMMVFPKQGLAAGTYTETVTITADAVLSQSFQVSITIHSLVNAETPVIQTQPSDQTTLVNGSRTLSVATAVADGGTLSYQWYSHTMNSNSGGTAIADATSATYNIPTNIVGTTYYYVVITNTNNSVNGTKTATVTSRAARALVHDPPTFTVSETAWTFPALTVGYTGTQVNAIKRNVILTKVGPGIIENVAVHFSGGASSSFMTGTVRPDALGDGTLSAVMMVFPKQGLTAGTYTETVTVTADGGLSESFQVSITINSLMSAEIPTITVQPNHQTIPVNGSGTLSTVATVADGGTLSYQWYSHTTNSNSGGTAIAGATNATYIIPTNVVGTTYYYVVITNTNNSVNGTKVVTITSNVAEIKVEPLVEHTVTFNLTGGSMTDPANVIVIYGQKINKPGDPIKAGYTFVGWYKDSNLNAAWDFTTDVVTGNTVLYAKWLAVIVPPNDNINNTNTEGPLSTTEQLMVNVQLGEGTEVSQLTINRTTNADGTVQDQVILTSQSIRDALLKLQGTQKKEIYIVLPTDTVNQVQQTIVTVPLTVLSMLKEEQIHLGIVSDDVKIDIPQSSLQSFEQELYFRIVPVRGEEVQQLQGRARTEELVRQLLGNANVTLLGQPMSIETNMQNHPVTLTLPLPQDVTQEQLENLAIYIEHSDGTKEGIYGDLVDFKGDTLGIQFEVRKFSTFSIVHVPQQENKVSIPYIQGYADGTFRPDVAVTRAQMASMLARYLTNNTIPTVQVSFKDTNQHGAKDAIEFVKSQGLFQGTTATTFNPNGTITRAQMAAVTMRWIERYCGGSSTATYCTESTSVMPFTDVNLNHWAAQAIAKVNALGIMTGINATTFNPEGSLTRAQAVKVLNQLFEYQLQADAQTPLFKDVTPAHWAFDNIQAAAQ
ncbi:S-layer homology domain-containing protein [Metasolibacillus sp.]|uniref:S-layer homology domain-containing protein n=1 Tax=Metasolibacillus sp. TaxID=2703680 RepID=UPI0025CC8A05|nr:S-layer homology domain-containing protein [Metasolibacillus sp.]MCT6925108.1 S-layer homology domain-containing protein [Metasolibacillus sp.]MCT6941312.1 S-layer homology domain-containing protein [Metasolibacillus sp.]